MSTIRNPVGPQSPQVYWRRRLVLGLGLLAVIIVIVLIVVRPGAADGKDPGASTAPAASESSSPKPSDEPVVDAGPETPCRPQSVKIEAIADKTAYAAGVIPQLSLQLTNIGASPCTVNAGTTQQVFEVGSGEEAYWLSTDCQTEPVDAPVVLEPNTPLSTAPLAWDRTRSSPCDNSNTAVPAGDATYYFVVKLGELESEPVYFRLL
ncbi:hypothetical protein [Homoserinimonas hongtaonis]|uniref:hypothetical protein n=1 Tax=Homoserinimonas hongtaonis TaxID=2079791 RepID=UPI000D345F32|nr:hypothetical protein [Salinibacterium hongtaonis]AWB90065.1 hypothetical protein C2138_11380 [Salinibacterium hongtaonis]